MTGAMFQAAQTITKSAWSGLTEGVASYFSSKAARAQARAQARISAANASMLRSQKVTQDIANRQALDQLAQQRSAVTAAYQGQQGANIAGAGAANVDISSGSAAKVLEGNAGRYAQDMARSRYAEALQMWQGESALSMLEAQAKGYDITSSAQRSIANMIDPLGNAIGTGLMSFTAGLVKSSWGQEKLAGLFESSGNINNYKLEGHDVPRMTDGQWDSLFKSYGL